MAAPEAYPAQPVRECHPDRLFAVGRLFGLTPPPVETCRVLEIGCGTGGHSLAAALTLPDATFVGIDLSEEQVRRGREQAAAAGITNVELRAADLMTFRPDPGSFDYVTAHGVYSWVPPAVRDRLLAVIREALAPNGVGYVSYNAYPGGHVREMFWNMLRFHTAAAADPGEKIALVRGFADFLAAGQAGHDHLTAQMIRAEADRLRKIPHPGMIHYDDLWEGNTPVYVTDFADHLSRHGLRYVAEAEVHTMYEGQFPPAVAAVLAGMREKDLVWKEQYIDFLKLRRFRLSVVAHAAVTPAAAPQASAVPEFAVGLGDRLTADTTDLAPGVRMTFQIGDRGSMALDNPFAKAAVLELAERWPGRVPFDELLARAAARVGEPVDDRHRAALADVLLSIHLRGPVEFFATPGRFATTPGERPAASPLARAQARDGQAVATLAMGLWNLADETTRTLVGLLDGSRDRAALAAELRRRIPDLPGDAAGLIERSLAQVAEAGLLVG